MHEILPLFDRLFAALNFENGLVLVVELFKVFDVGSLVKCHLGPVIRGHHVDVWLKLESCLRLKYLLLDGTDDIVCITKTAIRVPIGCLSHLSAKKDENWSVNLCSFQNLFNPIVHHFYLIDNFRNILAFFKADLT